MKRLRTKLQSVKPSFVDFTRPGFQIALFVLVMSLIQTASGGFDSDDVHFAHRFTLWLVIIGLTVLVFMSLASSLASLKVLQSLKARWHWFAAFLMTWPLASAGVEGLKRTPLLAYQSPDPFWDFMMFMLPGIGFICGSVCLILWRAERRKIAERQRSAYMPAPLEIQDRGSEWPLEPPLSVEVQDHYLVLVTDSSSHLVRGTMKDALAQLEPGSGLRIHRSWWVAQSAVTSVDRRGRDYTLTLKDGRVVPVARGKIPLLKEAGWI